VQGEAVPQLASSPAGRFSSSWCVWDIAVHGGLDPGGEKEGEINITRELERRDGEGLTSWMDGHSERLYRG
jgi:hypothetical protein